jgi:hypothetical protein
MRDRLKELHRKIHAALQGAKKIVQEISITATGKGHFGEGQPR